MTFLQKHSHRLIALALWLIVLAGYWGYTTQNNLSPLSTAQSLVDFFLTNTYGPLIYLSLYFIRPLLLFPTSILTLLAGFLFGPIVGLSCVLSGNIISAMVGYVTAYYLGGNWLNLEKGEGIIERYTQYLHQNGFIAILIMRLLLLNYDLVSYLGGFLQINWKAFLSATVLGTLAGSISYVLAGASIEGEFGGQWPTVDPWLLGISIILFVISLTIAWYLRQHQKTENASG